MRDTERQPGRATGMRGGSVVVHSLASGSSGNAVLVQSCGTNLLIDAGRSSRSLAALLAKRGIGPGNLHAILLTHEHSDHSSGAPALARRLDAPVVGTQATLAACLASDGAEFPCAELRSGGAMGIGAVDVRSFAVPHDAADPVGFVLDCGRAVVAYMTDCGSPTPAMRDALRGASLAIVEANHDVAKLWRGPYPYPMKARIASATGHLSNAECATLLAERLDESGPLHVWLAHLSRVNNSPLLARASIRATLRSLTDVPVVLEVALRDHPSVTWVAGSSAVQLNLPQ